MHCEPQGATACCLRALNGMRHAAMIPREYPWGETRVAQHKSILSIISGPSCSQASALWELIVALSHQGTLKEQGNQERGP